MFCSRKYTSFVNKKNEAIWYIYCQNSNTKNHIINFFCHDVNNRKDGYESGMVVVEILERERCFQRYFTKIVNNWYW